MSKQSEFVSNAMPMRGPGRAPIEKVNVKDIKATLLRLWKYLSAQKFKLAIAFVFIISNATLTIYASYLVRPIINNLLDNADSSVLISQLSLMGIVYVIANISYYIQSRLMLYIAQTALAKLRLDLFEKLETLPLKYFDSTNTGDLMSRFTNDVDAISQMLSNTCVTLLSGIITLISTTAIMFYTNWMLTLVILVVAPLFSMITKNLSNKSMKYYKGQQQSLGALNGFIEEHISGQKVIKVFNHENIAIQQMNELNENYRDKAFNAQFLAGTMGPIMGGLGQLTYVITACVGGLLCVLRGFDIGGYTIFVNYARSFSRPISDIFMQISTLFQALAGAERVFEVLDEEPEKADVTDAIEQHAMKGDVQFEHVHFSYVAGKEVLNDINIHANTSQKIAFVGSTGAGKTTFTNLLNRFYDIDSGIIKIDGIDIHQFKKSYLRENIAMVLQDTHLFSGTVMENIRYGRLDASDEEVYAAAKAANAHAFIIRLENGYDTILEGDGSNLSQGQRQLLNIARAAISKAPILVLDEATSSVDTRTERHIEEALDRLMETRTTFVIAHRLSTVRNSDMIIVLEHGKIIERGNHDELLDIQGKYHSLYTHASKLD